MFLENTCKLGFNMHGPVVRPEFFFHGDVNPSQKTDHVYMKLDVFGVQYK
jgi:hypothetical protein